MDASSLQHQQEIMASQSLDSMLVCTKSGQSQGQMQQEKKPRPAEQALKCPRCDSTNTKFCYYNNYSLTQPRYFCKACRRYWTKGGTLRNVPVGGGCRKNKRSSSSTSSSSSRSRTTPEHHHLQHHISTTPNTPSSISSFSSPFDHHPSASDLTLAFARLHRQAGVGSSMGLGGHEEQGSIPLLGNLNNPHFDLFGHSSSSSLVESQSNLQHLYSYGFGGGGSLGDVENGGGNSANEMGVQFDLYHNNHNQEMMSNPSSGSSTPTTTTTIKQELLGDQNRVLLGLPWQLTSGEGNYMINGGGQSWSSGVLGSPWHGLVNSPLM